VETRGRATVYWSQGRTNRQLAVYTKKAAEIIRVELRFLGSAAVRRAGLANLTSLRELNARKILEHNIGWFSPKDRFVQKMVRKAVSADRKQHKERQLKRRSPSAELFIDEYRSRIPIRAKYILRRVDMQWLRSDARSKFTQRFRLGDYLEIPECVSWPE